MTTQYFGEWVEYRDQEERDQANTYLSLWQKFFIRKLGAGAKVIEEQIVDRPNYEELSEPSRIRLQATLGLNLKVDYDEGSTVCRVLTLEDMAI